MGETPGKLAGIEQGLKTLNAIAAQINPLAGLVVIAVRGLIEMRKNHGLPTQEFEVALANYQQALTDAQAAVAEFQAHRDALK